MIAVAPGAFVRGVPASVFGRGRGMQHQNWLHGGLQKEKA